MPGARSASLSLLAEVLTCLLPPLAVPTAQSDAFFAFSPGATRALLSLSPAPHPDPPSPPLSSFVPSPGFGFPSSIAPGKLQVEAEAEWGETLPLVLETKCPLFITGFSPKDVERDVQSLGAHSFVSLPSPVARLAR